MTPLNREIVIEGAELQQSVYVYKCSGCTVQVRGKCSNIVLDQCNKTGLVFDSVVAGVELVNCQSVQVQVRSYYLLYLTILISTLSTHPCPGDRVCAHYLGGEDRQTYLTYVTSQKFFLTQFCPFLAIFYVFL